MPARVLAALLALALLLTALHVAAWLALDATPSDDAPLPADPIAVTTA